MVDVGVHVKRIASDLRETLESKAELYQQHGNISAQTLNQWIWFARNGNRGRIRVCFAAMLWAATFWRP